MPHPIFLALLLLLAPALHAEHHLGPVTDLLVADGKVYSVSQAGILAGPGPDLKLMVRPEHRVTSLALLRGAVNDHDVLVFAGGDPGVEGRAGSISPEPRENETCVFRKLTRDLLYDVASAPHGKHLAFAAADGSVFLSDRQEIAAGTQTVRHKHTAAACSVAFSPDGNWLASAGLDGVLLISPVEDRAEPPRQLLDHTAGIECLVFSPDSTMIASGSRDSRVRLHEVRSGKLIRTYTGLGMEHEPVAGRVPSRVLSLAWNGERLLAGTSKGSLHQLSLQDDTAQPIPRATSDPIYALAFVPGPARTLLLGTQSRLEQVKLDP